MSAHFPGAMEPSSWSIWKHWAQLMVTIWIAVTGSMPSCNALRMMWSRWPSWIRVSGWASSDTRQANRVSTLCSVMAFATWCRSCQAEPSRSWAYIPRRILARASSARVDS